MTDAFQAMVEKYHTRMALLREAFERDGLMFTLELSLVAKARMDVGGFWGNSFGAIQ